MKRVIPLVVEQRHATRMPRRWKALFGAEAPSSSGFTQDISEAGLFITATNLPQLGTRLLVKLETASLVTPVMTCEVVRHVVVPPQLRSVKRHGFGVRIVGDRAPLRDILNRERRQRVEGGVAPAAPAEPRVVFASEPEYLKARAEELLKGGLSFRASHPVAVNTAVEVLVVLGWCKRQHLVRGRTVHVREASGVRQVIVVLDEPEQALQTLDRLARS